MISINKNIGIPLRDGVTLLADCYLPEGGPAPVLLQRSPYDKERAPSRELFLLVQAGYAVVVQDTRGRFASGGVFEPFANEAEDGYDMIEWIATQPWCSGQVGMYGSSYLGATQWLAASQSPPALRAMAPYVTASSYHEGWTYQGGAFQLGFALAWTMGNLALGEAARRRDRNAFGALVGAYDRLEEWYPRLPLSDLPQLREVAPYYFDWLAHPDYDGYWRRTAPREHYDAVTAPVLNMGGWYDIFLGGTLENYLGTKERGGRLVIGPWAHGADTADYAERRFGLLAGVVGSDLIGRQLAWFDRHLRGQGGEDGSRVRIFVMGPDEWRDEDDWPLPDTRFTPYYLRSGGGLTLDSPQDEPEDVYAYDPRDPVPTIGGATFLPGLGVSANSGPRDQRPLDGRSDVLRFATEPLERPLELIGPVKLVLHASSSALDTDFTAKLVDVHPDGRAVLLTDGILRARYRNSLSEPEPLEPGRPYELRIDLVGTGAVVEAGHRIRVDVSSSNFPRFDRNTNTGGVIAEDGPDDLVTAVNRVYHDRGRPSRVVLPVISRG